MKKIMNSENDLYLIIGKTFLEVQRFEATLKGCIAIHYSINESNQKLEKILSSNNKDTLGNLVFKFRECVDLSQDFEIRFQNLLDRRNLFVHRLILEGHVDFTSQGNEENFRKFLFELREDINYFSKILIGFLVSNYTESNMPDDLTKFIDSLNVNIRKSLSNTLLAEDF